MTARHAALVVAALAVLGLGVYLFIEVRAVPATVMAPPVQAEDAPPPPRPPSPPPPAAGSAFVPLRAPRGLTRSAGDRAAAMPVPVEAVATLDGSAAPTGLAPDAQKLDAIMSEANKAYDRGDYEEARAIAGRVLAAQPTNVRMLRILVSSSCIEGDSVEAQRAYLQLPALDRAAMRTRCDRYGVTFTE